MPSRIWLRLAEIVVAAVLALAIFKSWEADRRDRSQLASQLAAAQQTLAEATTRQHDRDTLLTQTLTDLAAQKRSVVTPAQILRDLPREIPLPVPISLQPAPPTDTKGAATGQGSTPGKPADAVIPSEDLKPLYDFAIDCKACQAKLSASQNDLNDEKTKTATLAKERDAAVRAAKGGSALRRILRATKWFVIGAAAGVIAAKAAH